MDFIYEEFIVNLGKYYICIENKVILCKIILNFRIYEKIMVIWGIEF